MPKGIYKRKQFTEEHRINISNSLKGNKNPNFGKFTWIKGKHHSEETRKKLSETHKGKKFSEEHKKNIGLSSKGRHHTAEVKLRIGNSLRKFLHNHKVDSYRFKENNIPWNKNRKGIYSKEHIEKLRNSHLGRKNHFYGKHHSEKTKKQLSENNKNRVVSIETKEKLRRGRLGKHHSLEARKKMSLIHKGSKCYMWKGGISSENKRIRSGLSFSLWRGAVFSRDNWTCQDCKKRGGILHPHHINSFAKYPELRFELTNGITLCKDCHIKIHIDCKLALEKLGIKISAA